MKVTLYMDAPKVDADTTMLHAFTRPAFETPDGWSRWRVDLDTETGQASVRLATLQEHAGVR